MQRAMVVIAVVMGLLPAGVGPSSADSVPAQSPPLVAGLDFISQTTGWVVLYSPQISHVGNACDYDLSRTPITILKTVDAGRYWTPELHFIGDSSVVENRQLPGVWLHFVNAQDGFVSGPTTRKQSWLYRTSNGGRTWRKLPLPGMPGGFIGEPFSFTSARNGWLLADVGAAMGQSSANVFHTSDGGLHWVKVAHAGIVGHPGNLGSAGDKNTIVFRNRSVGWVTASSAVGPGLVYSTTDGGKQWLFQALSSPRHGLPRDVLSSQGTPYSPVIFGRSSGFLAADVLIDRASSLRPGSAKAEPFHVYLFSLARDGRHWINPRRLPGTDNLTHPMYWQLLDPRRWWVGAGNTLRQTVNGGRSWQTYPLLLPRGFTMTQLDFVGPTHGWAIAMAGAGAGYPACASILLRTTDSGARWKPVTIGG
jgi:photosystem II stability/assembly factor-like uncharacterized protein